MKTSSIHLQTTNNLHSSKQFVLYFGSHLQQGQEGKLLNPIILRVRDQRKAEIRQFPYKRSSRTQFWHVSTICKRLQSSEKSCESCQLGYKMQNLVSQERLWTKWWGKASKEEKVPFAWWVYCYQMLRAPSIPGMRRLVGTLLRMQASTQARTRASPQALVGFKAMASARPGCRHWTLFR